MVKLLFEVNHSSLQGGFDDLGVEILAKIGSRSIFLDRGILDWACELSHYSRFNSKWLGYAFAKLTILNWNFQVLEASLIQMVELCLAY